MTGDLINTSGREDLSLEDRAGLLRQDILWMQGFRPEMPRGLSWTERRRFIDANGATIHDVNCTIGYAQNVISVIESGRKIAEDRLGLSQLECLIFAWRRGGLAEYKRVRELQKAGK